jgi:hypothetical protein
MKKTYIFMLALYLILNNQVFGGGFASLKRGADARAGAMGMAYTALASDGSGSYWNPASLVQIDGIDVIIAHQQWLEDVNTEFFGIGRGNLKYGTGIYLLYTSVQNIEYRRVPSAIPLGTFSSHELIAGFSFSRMLNNNLSIGLSIKLLYEKIFIDEAWGVGGDLGILWWIWNNKIRVGGVLQNVGKTGKLKNEKIALPLIGKIGMAIPFKFLNGSCIFVLDGITEQDFPFRIHGGIEYSWCDLLFLRGGYQVGYDIREWTTGIGFGWGKYRIDYSYMPIYSDLGDSHHFTLGIKW